MVPEKFDISIGYDENNRIIWHLEMISLDEEIQYTQRFNDAADKPNRRDLEYRVTLDALRTWSYEPPTIVTNVDGVKDQQATSVDILEGFSSRTPGNERIIDTVMIHYRTAMMPDVRFL